MSKGYDSKTKMEQEQWLQLKMLFLLGYNLKVVIQLGEINFWWGGGGGGRGGGNTNLMEEEIF